MTTDMPEVIYAGDYDEETLSVTAYDHAVGNYQKYIRADKHEELKAIAEKMAFSLKKISMMPNHYGEMRKEATNALTEYNKYKGEK